jgi:hypothetical protein
MPVLYSPSRALFMVYLVSGILERSFATDLGAQRL